MNIRKQAGYLGVGGKRVIGGLGSNTALDALIRSLAPAAWFRPGVGITVTGAGVSQWDDQSGNGRHLLQGTDAARPIDLPFSGTRYLYLPGVAGNYASTPDSAANSITGDIDIRVLAAMDDETPAASMCLAGKMGVDPQRAWRFGYNTTGTLFFSWYPTGSLASAINISSTVAAGVADAALKWRRITIDVDNGAGGYDAKFWLSDDGASWTQLGTTITGGSTTSLPDVTAALEVGARTGGSEQLAGKIYRAIIKNGIDGTTVVDFNPADADGDGDTSFASSTTGETWTINSSGGLPAQIVGRAAVLFNGTSHYLKCNAFTLNQPTCVLMVVKQVSWTSSDYLFDGNTNALMACLQQTSSPRLGLNAGTSLGTNTDLAVGSVGIVAATFNGASSSLRVNNGAPLSGNAGTNNAGGFTIGAAGLGAAAFSNIQVYETVIFPIAPSTAQLDRLIAGLMARHSIP